MTPEDAKKLYLEQLEAIRCAIRFACARASLRDQDAEDFASNVHLKLIDNDYAVIRKHDSRSSFRGYIGVVVQHLLLDHRNAEWGKFHASAEAKRIGEPAITIEAFLYRDGRTIEEVLPALLRRWPELTREKVEELANALPVRCPRARAVDIESAFDVAGADGDSVHDAAFESARAELAHRIEEIVRSTLQELEPLDRLLFRLHFEGGMTIANVARAMQTEQKPLYRRRNRILARLRARLEAAGIDATDALELLSARGTGFDFGFESETMDVRTSDEDEEE